MYIKKWICKQASSYYLAHLHSFQTLQFIILYTMTKPASLTYLEASTPLEEIYKVIERDGGVIIRNFLSSELQELGEDFFPSGSLRIYGLLGKIPQVITKIVRLPTWQGVMARFLK